MKDNKDKLLSICHLFLGYLACPEGFDKDVIKDRLHQILATPPLEDEDEPRQE